MTDTGAESRPWWGRASVFHPLLFALYPILFLFAQNQQQGVRPSELVQPLLLALAASALLFALLSLVLRNPARAALLTTLFVALFFAYGHVRHALAGVLPDGVLLAAWGGIAVAGIALVFLIGRLVMRVNLGLTVLAAVLLAFNFVTIGSYQLGRLGRPAGALARVPDASADPSTNVGAQPDIYYLVFDRYGSDAVLEEFYDFDNSPFLAALEERGFYVAPDSKANYPSTAPSLGAILNMDYVSPEALEARAAGGNDWTPYYELVSGDSAVEDGLHARGYTYVHLGAWWEPSATNSAADASLRYEDVSEFSTVLQDSTLLTAFSGLGDAEQPLDFRDRSVRHTLFQFDTLAEVPEFEEPTFAFAHFLFPHDPYVFDSDGNIVSEAEEHARPTEENYIDQLQYANRRIIELIDTLMATSDPEPIIIIHAEEGPYPPRYDHGGSIEGLPWSEATPEELRQKFGILNAYRLPGVDPEEAGLYPSISPVNTFRVVFNAYFGTDLELLPDRSFIYDDGEHLFDLTEITDVLE